MTTIKLRIDQRDWINEFARESGGTAATAIDRLIAEHERAERFRIMREQWRASGPYDDEGWDALAGDGLPSDDD
jgi:hypothetical protein